MRPTRWLDPTDKRNDPLEGQIRIVRLADGTMRAAVWRRLYANSHYWYCDRNGDGIEGIVEVGVPS